LKKKDEAGVVVKDQNLPSVKADVDMFKHCIEPKTVSIIGAPMTFGQPFTGTDSGPRLLRESGLRKKLSALGWRVEDFPDIDFDHLVQRNNTATHYNSRAKNSTIVGEGAKLVADAVYNSALQGHFPLVLGGDHSIGIGSLAGILRARPNAGVIWVDAHADLNTPKISESGNMHGMPVGLLIKEIDFDHKSIPGLEWLATEESSTRLDADSIVYVGLRDVDFEERVLIKELGIKTFTMTDIDRYGIGAVMDMAITSLLKKDPTRPIHLSYDIDAVDPLLAPATGTAVRGGLTYREAHYIAEAAASSGHLASADLVELNPQLSDPAGAKETVEVGLQILTSLMGKSII